MTDMATIGFKADTKGLEDINKNLDVMTKEAVKAEKALEEARKELNSATTPALKKAARAARDEAATAYKKLKTEVEALKKEQRVAQKITEDQEKAFAAQSRSMGQAGIQFQQFIGQVQAGQSPMLALSQQAADLGIVLGAPLLGAVAGITASLAGIFIPTLFETEEATKSLDDSVQSLIGNFNKFSASQQNVAKFAISEKLKEMRKEANELQITINKVESSLTSAEGADFGIFQGLLGDDPEKLRGNLAALKAELLGLGLEIKDLEDKSKDLNGEQERTSRTLENSNAKLGELVGQMALLQQTTGLSAREMVLYEASVLGADAGVIQLINDTFDLVDAQKQSEQQQKAQEKAQQMANKSYADSVLALEMQRQKLILTSDEYEIMSLRMREMAKGTAPELIDQLVQLTKANQELKNSTFSDKEIKAFDTIIDKVDAFGGAWSRTGNQIADSFGSAADVLNDYASRMEEITGLQERLNAAKASGKLTTEQEEKANKSLARLSEESLLAQLSGVRSLTALTSQMFSENSKERKALHALEMGFAAAEIAIAAQKAITNAAASIAAQGTLPPPASFAAVASMIGLMTGVLGAAGVAFSASSGSYSAPVTGTGTVLGDSSAQSASISASIDLYEEIQLDQLAELKGIKEAVTDLDSGITKLAKTLITGLDFSGSSVGGLGTTSQFSTSQFGASLTSGLSNTIVDRLTGGLLSSVASSLIGGISKTTRELVDSGIDVWEQTIGYIIQNGEAAATSFQAIKTTTDKFWGLSSSSSLGIERSDLDSEVTSSIADLFLNISDSIQQSLMLLQLSTENSINEFLIKGEFISFKDKTGEEIEKELQAFFSKQADLMTEFLLPSINEYQQLGEGAYETLLRLSKEQAQFNSVLNITNASLNETGENMLKFSQSIITMVGGIDAATEAANVFYNEFLTESQRFSMLSGSLTDAFSTIGLSIPQTREGINNLIAGLDLTTQSGQEAYALILRLIPSLDQYYDTLEDRQEEAQQLELQRQEQFIDAVNNSMSVLKSAVNTEKERAELVRSNAQETYDAEISRIKTQRTVINEQQKLAEQGLSDAVSAVNAAFDAERNMVQKASDLRVSAINDEISLLNDRKSGLNSIINDMSSLAERLSNATGKTVSIGAALSAARRGDFSLAQSLSGELPDASAFSTEAEFRAAQAVAKNQLSAISDLASGKASSTQMQLDRLIGIESSLNAQIEREQASAQRQIEQLNEQQNTLLGIDTSVLSINDASIALAEAQAQLDSLHTEQMLEALDRQEETAISTLNAAELAYLDEIERLDGILATGQEQVNALLGIENATLSINEALAEIQLLTAQANETKIIRPGDFIEPIKEYLQEMSGESSTQGVSLKDSMQAVAKSTAATAKTLKNIELGGLDTRQIVEETT